MPEVTQPRLFSPRQLFVAALIGSPIAAAWFSRRNFLARGEPKRATSVMVQGVALTFVLVGASFVLPERISRLPIAALVSLAIYRYAFRLFPEFPINHRGSHVAENSWWSVIVGSVLCLVILLAVGFAAVVLDDVVPR